MQKSTTNTDKAQHLQVTYANAMPRLASANAYLTKQSRKMRPNNLTGGSYNNAKSSQKGMTASSVLPSAANSNNRNMFSLPRGDQSNHHVASAQPLTDSQSN